MPKSLPGAASSLSPPTLRIRAPEGLAGAIDPETHAAVSARLAIQEQDAIRWHDACLLYFQTFSKRPFPDDVEAPRQSLTELKASDPLAR
ncbi:MAG: hypothetical protein H7A49_11705 [Akkermansiaceae bacterium]|nr:hypothetical protein [Akkermansiaceae bacterium]MCP5544558.1 hypothetical protein [Akkermansiaceae bacterium]MCP5547974.1 hypothetical protein [Akkermansiaceae bacterium]